MHDRPISRTCPIPNEGGLLQHCKRGGGHACAVIILCTNNRAARENISSHDNGQKVNFAWCLILAAYVGTTSGYNRDHLEIATWVSVLLFPFYRGGAKRLKKHEVEAPGPIEEAIARITRGTNKRCFYLTARMREGEGERGRARR